MTNQSLVDELSLVGPDNTRHIGDFIVTTEKSDERHIRHRYVDRRHNAHWDLLDLENVCFEVPGRDHMTGLNSNNDRFALDDTKSNDLLRQNSFV